jgi:hypothetical protein
LEIEMADEEQSLEEWMEEEQARLKKGFTHEPKPGSEAGKPGTAEEILAGVGLGAGVVGGAVAPHPNPVTFEGCKASVIANALQSEIPSDDTRVEITRSGDAVVVSILQGPEGRPYDFSPALGVTLLEKADTLTVTVGKLSQDSVRDTLGSMGGTVLEQGKRVLTGDSAGIGGLIDMAGSVIEGVGDLVEDVQDLSLPKRVWEVIDRVGGAAQEAYLEEQHRKQKSQQEREAAERAWTHCTYCGRAYGKGEDDVMTCPACRGPRGSKPAWLK